MRYRTKMTFCFYHTSDNHQQYYMQGVTIDTNKIPPVQREIVENNPAIFEPLKDEKEIEELNISIYEENGELDQIYRLGEKLKEVTKTINALVREVEKIKEEK